MRLEMRYSELIGRKNQHQPILNWLNLWNQGVNSDNHPAIIVGESGVGKSTLAKAICEKANLYPQIEEEGDILRLESQMTTRTLMGQKRVAIVDDASYLSKKVWKEIKRISSLKTFPLILIVEDILDVEYSIRRSALVLQMSRPTENELLEYLLRTAKQKDIVLEPTRAREIASESPTWRTAFHLLLTSPANMESKQMKREIWKNGHEQTEAILLGQHNHPDFTVHPLNIIQTAEYNGADIDSIESASWLYNRAWDRDGLTTIMRDFLLHLRCLSVQRLPFRKKH